MVLGAEILSLLDKESIVTTQQDFLLQIVCLAELRPPSAIAIRMLLADT